MAAQDVFVALLESVVGADGAAGSGGVAAGGGAAAVAVDDVGVGDVGQPTGEPESGGSRLAPSSRAHMESRSQV